MNPGEDTVLGYSTSALASPIRVPFIGSAPPIIPMLTQRSNVIIPPMVNELSSPRGIPDLNSQNISPIIPISSIIPIPQMSPSPPLIMNKKSPGLIKNLDMDIIKKLESYKYKVIETINLQSGNNVEARYVKAIDNRGHYIIIELDVDSSILYRPTDLTTVEIISPANELPQSVKSGLLASISDFVSGVAIECKDIIYILYNKLHGQTKDLYLHIIHKPENRSELDADCTLGIPIIKM